MLGYKPEEIIGRTPFDLMVAEDAVAIAPVFQRLIRERTGCTELKNRNRHKDRREVVLLTSCVPMLNEAGELLGFRGVDKDVTARERMERSLLQQTRELEALLATGRAIAASIDYDEVLRRVAQAAGEALGTAECVIWEHCADGETAVFRCLWQRDPQPGVAESLQETSYAIRSHAGGLDALRAGVVVQQSRTDPDLPPGDAEDMDRWGEKTWLTVPLVLDGELLGIMILIESERERRFDPDEVRMAGVIGEQAAVALHNALRHRREERQNRWLRALVSAARVISESQDPDTALGEVARLAAGRDAVAGRVRLRVRRRPRRARHAGELGLRSRRERRPRRHGLGGLRGAGGPPRAAGGAVRRDAVRPGAPPEREGAHGALGRADPAQRPAALARGRHRRMTVVVEDQDERTFDAEELDFMRAFGDQVTLALSTARSATTDGLTGLANHRVFYERLGQELARARRYGTTVSLLMIDIDDFKELNDTYGHPAGDEALRRLGRLLAEHLRRDIDLPARYGGEEFAVILPNTGVDGLPLAEEQPGARPAWGVLVAGHREGAEALAERLRAIIWEHPLATTEDGCHMHVAGEHRSGVVPGDGGRDGRPGGARRRRALRGQARGQGPRRGVLAARGRRRPRLSAAAPPEPSALRTGDRNGRPPGEGRPATCRSLVQDSYFARSSSA